MLERNYREFPLSAKNSTGTNNNQVYHDYISINTTSMPTMNGGSPNQSPKFTSNKNHNNKFPSINM
jgi:hypothetical protein